MWTRRSGWTLLAVTCLAAMASAQAPERDLPVAGQPPSFVPPAPPVSSNPAAELLFKRVDSIDWTERTFEDVIRWLRDESNGRVNVVFRETQLGVEGVTRDSLVTLQLNNTTVADVLNETLEQLSETGEARYRAIGNKLTISTRADFERTMHTRVYDVTDILFRVPNFGQNAPEIDLQQAGRSGGSGGGGGGQGVFSGAGGQEDDEESGQQAEQETEQRMNALRQLIEQTIAPETWDLTGSPSAQSGATGGGGRGRIRVFNRSLVVTNTVEVHEMIGGLFAFGE